MGLEIKVKDGHRETKIGFGGSAKPLKDRNYQDLVKLGIMAHESGNPNLLAVFETLPSLADLKMDQTDRQLAEITNIPTTPAPVQVIGNGNTENKPSGIATTVSEGNAANAAAAAGDTGSNKPGTGKKA